MPLRRTSLRSVAVACLAAMSAACSAATSDRDAQPKSAAAALVRPPVAAASAAPNAGAAAAAPVVDTLEWAAAGDWRLPAEKARDAWRHPVATLRFFGVKPSDTVVEISPGGGWYTAILGPYLKTGGGKLIAAHFDPTSSAAAAKQVEVYRAAFVAHPETFGQITMTTASKTSPGLAPDGSADVVLTFRNVHNWMQGGYAEKVFADAFRALKPDGTLGVEEHRLPSSRQQDPTGSSGYVQEAYVRQLAEGAGFEYVASSEINANPKDKADWPLGVWMLPPNLRSTGPDGKTIPGYNAETYKAIGESDRMTLKFRKPG